VQPVTVTGPKRKATGSFQCPTGTAYPEYEKTFTAALIKDTGGHSTHKTRSGSSFKNNIDQEQGEDANEPIVPSPTPEERQVPNRASKPRRRNRTHITGARHSNLLPLYTRAQYDAYPLNPSNPRSQLPGWHNTASNQTRHGRGYCLSHDKCLPDLQAWMTAAMRPLTADEDNLLRGVVRWCPHKHTYFCREHWSTQSPSSIYYKQVVDIPQYAWERILMDAPATSSSSSSSSPSTTKRRTCAGATGEGDCDTKLPVLRYHKSWFCANHYSTQVEIDKAGNYGRQELVSTFSLFTISATLKQVAVRQTKH
jgi:hypothetical protein